MSAYGTTLPQEGIEEPLMRTPAIERETGERERREGKFSHLIIYTAPLAEKTMRFTQKSWSAAPSGSSGLTAVAVSRSFKSAVHFSHEITAKQTP